MNVRAVFLFACLLCASAVDRSKFITCQQSAFCKRNRDAAKKDFFADDIAATLTQAKAKIRHNTLNLDLVSTISAYKDNIWRLQVDEGESATRVRYRMDDILQFHQLEKEEFQSRVLISCSSQKIGNTWEFTRGDNRLALNPETLQWTIHRNDKHLLSVNKEGRFNFEQTLPRGMATLTLAAAEGGAEAPAVEGGGHENFGSHTDHKPYGPQAVSLDFTFEGSLHLYGIPEHSTSLALKDTKGESDPFRLYNLDVFEYEIDQVMSLYGSVPFLLSHTAEQTLGMFWANPSETWIDLATTDTGRSSHWISEAGQIDVWFLLGPTPIDVFRQFAKLTGAAQLPPMFAIGYHQCRWNYRDEPDVKAVDAGFDEYNIPYDVLWLDIEHTDGKRYFTWDSNKFPTPEEMQNNIASKGRRMVTIIDPHIKRDSGYHIYSEAQTRDLFIKNHENKEYDGWCWPGSSAYLDFVDKEVRDWWSEQFDYSKYKGSTNILFTWNDMNEPSVFNGPEVSMHKDALHRGGVEHREVHNIYGSYMQEATYNGQLRRNPEAQRPFVLSRAFFAGSQRWGAIWTGDNAAEWSHLSASNPMIMSIGLAGIPFAGADVGGFFEKTQNPVLMTRWWQLGAFQPFFRGHGHLDTKRREPWLFGEPYTTHIRAAIQSRYVHLPYLYTLFHQAHDAGVPVMRPMWVEFPKETSLFAVDSQFMLGEALLVRSVGEEENNAGKASVTLPAGRWYDIENFQEVAGPVHIADCPLSKLPVFQRGGTIIPKKERQRRSSSQMAHDPFTLQVAADETGQAAGNIYVDDGVSFKYETSEFVQGTFTYAGSVLKYTRTGGALQLDSVIERIRIIGVSAPTKVVFDSHQTTASFDYDSANKVLTVRKPGLQLNSDWELSLL